MPAGHGRTGGAGGVERTRRSRALVRVPQDLDGVVVPAHLEEGQAAGRRPDDAPRYGDVLKIEGWRPYIKQEGQAVFRWATTALAPLALQACERAGVAPTLQAARVSAVVSNVSRIRRENFRTSICVPP